MTNLRTVDEINNIFCNNVMAKSCVTCMKLAIHLKQGPNITVNEELFWTELHGAKIHSEHLKKRFKTFVANSIHQIKSNSDMSHYIHAYENPADNCVNLLLDFYL